jgi:glycosyltransferase involved in cell wall biosynthesis
VPELIEVITRLDSELDHELEAVFVVDGSPDKSWELLEYAIGSVTWPAQLLAHSRNFGSFAAVRTGLRAARGAFCAVMAADLQEPPELILKSFQELSSDRCDVAIGTRDKRSDPALARFGSRLFWALYRRTVVRDMPPGGVDVFACNRLFLENLLELEEARSSLIALVFWLGFRRKFIPYERLERRTGSSGWSVSKKFEYMSDSIFAFTDYPIRFLIKVGSIGVGSAAVLGILTLIWRFAADTEVPGYAATMIAILFFGALNLLGLGIVGMYAWRSYENSKSRPLAIVARKVENR